MTKDNSPAAKAARKAARKAAKKAAKKAAGFFGGKKKKSPADDDEPKGWTKPKKRGGDDDDDDFEFDRAVLDAEGTTDAVEVEWSTSSSDEEDETGAAYETRVDRHACQLMLGEMQRRRPRGLVFHHTQPIREASPPPGVGSPSPQPPPSQPSSPPPVPFAAFFARMRALALAAAMLDRAHLPAP